MEENKNARVLGLTRNNNRYKNVPDDLKWAIPLVELQRQPEFIAAQREMEARVKQRLEKEKATNAQARRPFKIIHSNQE